MMGMTMKVTPQRNPVSDIETLENNIYNVYAFRGLTDPHVHKDENSRRLLGNYRACVLHLAERYKEAGRDGDIEKLMSWAEDTIYMSWDGYYTASDFLLGIGQKEIAASYVRNASNMLIDQYGIDPIATYENALALAGILLNEPYSRYDKAIPLYRRIIDLEPARWNAYYELAAALQARGDAQDALSLLEQYRAQYGQEQRLLEAENILRNSLQKNESGESNAQP